MVLISSIKFKLKQTLLVQNIIEKRNAITHICETVWCQQILYHRSLSISYLHNGCCHTFSELCNVLSHQGFYKWLH